MHVGSQSAFCAGQQGSYNAATAQSATSRRQGRISCLTCRCVGVQPEYAVVEEGHRINLGMLVRQEGSKPEYSLQPQGVLQCALLTTHNKPPRNNQYQQYISFHRYHHLPVEALLTCAASM